MQPSRMQVGRDFALLCLSPVAKRSSGSCGGVGTVSLHISPLLSYPLPTSSTSFGLNNLPFPRPANQKAVALLKLVKKNKKNASNVRLRSLTGGNIVIHG